MLIKVCKFVFNFKLWDGMLIGVCVIFCNIKMYEFMDCLIIVVLFCVCDFCGVNDKSFDGCGNYFMGIME